MANLCAIPAGTVRHLALSLLLATSVICSVIYWTSRLMTLYSILVVVLVASLLQRCITCTSIQTFLELEYSQFLAVIDFLYPEAVFSTEHGVKGEEYDNVVFVISKGWNQYQFETYAPMITGYSPIPKGKEAAFERNRNLFYVCCSRPKKRLFFFVTVPIEPAFRAFLISLVGEENIHTYQQFVEMES